MQVRYPFAVERTGAVAEAGETEHIEQMIEQVLFTSPGERVNLPDFGCGLQNLLFEPSNTELSAVTNALVRGALLKWLGDLIHVEALTITSDGGAFTVSLSYALLQTHTRRTVDFVR
jgi:phage baseplate assembly protein W